MLLTRLFLPFAGGYFLSYLFRTVNAVVGPVLSAELSLGAADLGLLTSTYFIAFGAAQLPLGLLLDRFGPRRVDAALLLLAAAGAACFAVGESIGALAVGRGLIGFGVSACFMASLKSFWLWFPAERQASLTGWIMTSGTLGALVASAPMSALLHIASWREVFLGLSLLTLCVALWIFIAVPDKPSLSRPEPLSELFRGIGQVLESRHFWRFASLGFAQIGGFMAVQALWSGAWLMQVNGYSRSVAADHIAAMSATMIVSYFLIGLLSPRLATRGLGTVQLLGGGMSMSLVMLVLIATDAFDQHYLLWCAYGLFSSTGTLTYTANATGFPVSLFGRANTVLNLLAFLGAFGIQWGMGVLIERAEAGGLSSAIAYRNAFGVLIALQAASLVWFFLCGRRARDPSRE
jgi:nitrate/nitrite transporter NarK